LIYLDHAATTPLRPEVEEAMQAAGREGFANPSSQHAAGRRARQILEDARERILGTLGCRSTGPDRHRLFFTSGASEANRMAVLGAGRPTAGAVGVSARDHTSLRAAAGTLAMRAGWRLTELPLDNHGTLAPATIASWLDHTHDYPLRLLCSTLVCGQTGTIQTDLPRSQFSPGAAGATNCLVHADATQAAAFTDLDVSQLGVTTVTLAPHKFGGPRGIGALVVRGDVDLEPLHPGPQETGMRGGTEPVALAAGFATALEMAATERADTARRLARLRERFEARVLALTGRRGIGCAVIGVLSARSPHLSTIAFEGRDRQAIAMAADLAGLCLATGTACASGSSEPAPALAAMGLPKNITHGAVRFSFGRATTEDSVDRAIEILDRVLS
jgi:cysteine desulfurase